MNAACVAVTGANGFIGSALTRRFVERGARVVALTRGSLARVEEGVTRRAFDLRAVRAPRDLLAGVDVLVHAAVQVRPEAGEDVVEVNVRGTRELLEIARACGVRRRIFLSSFSAGSDARSAYGRQKHALEALFSGPGDSVVRPGLVIGDGGLFGRLARDLRTRRIVPLVDGGAQPLQTIHVEDLLAALERIIHDDIPGTFALAEPVPIRYAAFQADLCARLGVAPLFIPIPFAVARLALAACAALGVSVPIGRDSLLGLKAMRSRETRGDIERLGIRVRSVRESLDAFFSSVAAAGRAT